MKHKWLLMLWGLLFLLCAGLGFLPEPEGTAKGLCTAAALLFFLPPGILLYRGHQEKDLLILQLIRNLAGLSLGVTLVLLLGNLLSVSGGEVLGDLMYCLLIVVSSPMVCSGFWALSLFLWACLLVTSLRLLKGTAAG